MASQKQRPTHTNRTNVYSPENNNPGSKVAFVGEVRVWRSVYNIGQIWFGMAYLTYIYNIKYSSYEITYLIKLGLK